VNRIALVTHTTSYGAAGFVEACRRAGTGVVLASDRCHVLDRAWHWPADSLVIDFGDPDAAAALIAAADARESPISAVLPVGGELPAKVAAAAARRLGLPANAPAAMASAANKLLMRRQLAAAAAVDAAVRQPRFMAVGCGTPTDEVVRRVTASDGVGFPCVVKPLVLSGSRGVMRADDATSLAAAISRLERLLADPAVRRLDPEAAGQFLVESFVAGPEFALEGLLTRGALHVLALFDKPDPLDGPTFEETLYVTPSRLPAAHQRRIEEAVAAAAGALGLETGPVHAELRWSRGDDAPVLIAPGAGGLRPPEPIAVGVGPTEGPTLIEMAARPIGGLCSRTLRFENGLSLEDVVVRHALGTGAVPTRLARASGVMMIPIPARVPSALRAVDGVDDARAVAGIEDVVISVRVGETLVPLPEGASYTGFVFASGATAADVEQALREATSRLKFTVAPLVPVAR
jgi:biotin carboxylase